MVALFVAAKSTFALSFLIFFFFLQIQSPPMLQKTTVSLTDLGYDVAESQQ